MVFAAGHSDGALTLRAVFHLALHQTEGLSARSSAFSVLISRCRTTPP
jgi:hypothetical protein